MTSLSSPGKGFPSLTNYVAFLDPISSAPRIGHYAMKSEEIQPLSFVSGTPLENLYQVIEAGESNIKASGSPIQASATKILPPITGRDILCVGKNYAEHAKEFNSSGFDSSDKVDQPTHPVIFTKRFSSIIATGEEIYPHLEFTQTPDYEGEIGVIIGKPGFRISEAEAMDYVWGYTIINDMTARERQRDHKQFYIGKSPDTFCPMGPIAVPASKLDKVLRVQTYVNGQLRQDATTDDLIFSIPFLIKTMSEGQTLMPGDVLATGTPAGVGIGRKPPTYLQPGDTVTVTVSGLGKLENRIADAQSVNATVKRIEQVSHIKPTNAVKSVSSTNLTMINNKSLYYKTLGQASGSPVVFVHGLGGTVDYWTPLIHRLGLEKTHSLHLFDLEGHGLSPTSPLSSLTVASFAEDLNGVFEHANITSGATLIVHSMGCLIAATFALAHPDKVSKLVLLGPPASPLPEAASERLEQRAETARTKGMAAVVDAVATTGTSEKTKSSNPLALTAVRLLLLGQDPEGHAKAISALAASSQHTIAFGDIKAKTLIVTGSEDVFGPPGLCEKYLQVMDGATLKVLEDVGHWHVFENLAGVTDAISSFL
ncbi:fumarylacetoacetate hydrolase-like protein [Lophiotrema nucula]|uniref:Fumarylacetoacetate hydrolase-like protein n=1 Tax=Lophiotrema nucula TaxID=690887 RepID=A0A6A5ZU57_9PLEO|nr:fumarylacetoacetate hydrolase-like protein [Lophiotrema nucula]